MDHSNQPAPETGRNTQKQQKEHNLSGEAFIQNPDQNNQIHKAAMGPNTKR